MPIIDTTAWLKYIYNEKGFHRKENKIPPFNRLMNHYPSWEKMKWLQLLVENGMPPASIKGKTMWEKWAKRDFAHNVLTTLFMELKESFVGPDVDVFPFPMNEDHHDLMEIMNKKNGLSFKSLILLFFHESLKKEEIEALLIHEYHHAARLYHRRKNEMTVSLLESIVMEGLAEFEVERRLGKEFVSPWMGLYKEEELLQWWHRSIKNKRSLKGRSRQLPYIYGGKYGIPQWLGYSLGYSLVHSYIKKETAPPSPSSLLKTPSEKIYEGSIFYEKDLS